jgi:hypothetical protein
MESIQHSSTMIVFIMGSRKRLFVFKLSSFRVQASSASWGARNVNAGINVTRHS